jgi:hypothetical protein
MPNDLSSNASANLAPRSPRTGFFVTQTLAREALTMALLMIEPAVRDKEVSGCGFLHIVVMDPGLAPADVPFEQAILLEHSIGRAAWDADYAMYARAKARLSWEHGLDGATLQATRPHLLREGDALLWGGVCLDGLVVGVSGAYPWYDEAFGTAIAANLRALCKRDHGAMLAAGQAFARAPAQGTGSVS